jgi:hypothetical protein
MSTRRPSARTSPWSRETLWSPVLSYEKRGSSLQRSDSPNGDDRGG